MEGGVITIYWAVFLAQTVTDTLNTLQALLAGFVSISRVLVWTLQHVWPRQCLKPAEMLN